MRVTRCLELLDWGFYHHNLSLIRLYRGMEQGKHVFTTYLLYEIQYSTYKNITLSHSSFPTSTTFAVDTREKGENVYLETVTSLGHDNVSTMLMNSDTVRTHLRPSVFHSKVDLVHSAGILSFYSVTETMTLLHI